MMKHELHAIERRTMFPWQVQAYDEATSVVTCGNEDAGYICDVWCNPDQVPEHLVQELTRYQQDTAILIAEVRRLRGDLTHARHSANAGYAAVILARPFDRFNKRDKAQALWDASVPHCECPASDGWEAGQIPDVPE